MNARLLLPVVLLGLGACASAPSRPTVVLCPDAPRDPAAVAKLAWLSGEWRQAGETTEIERWGAPTGGMLLGNGQALAKNGETAFFEYLRIEQRGDAVYYVANPRGEAPTEFCLKAFEERRAVFENRFHDFPKRLTYALEPDGRLFIRIEGEENGKPLVIDERLEKVR